MLSSPRFLFRLEEPPATARAGQNYRISDLELASRLSFFLWDTRPRRGVADGAARQNCCTRPAVLDDAGAAHAGRPAQPSALSTRFAAQWLRLQDVDKMLPDAMLYPVVRSQLGAAFKRETELLFDSIVREDRSVLDLLTADYTFVNERLARHYGIPNVTGRRFPPRDARPALAYRRGLLGQGSLLMLTSVADRTSPVQRGKWIMEVLLGSPPPPPPPNVPALDETKPARPAASTLVDARAHGGAPQEPGVRVVPSRDRSAGPRARELRRDRRVADQGQRRAGRRDRRCCTTARRSTARRACAHALLAALGHRCCARSPRT